MLYTLSDDNLLEYGYSLCVLCYIHLDSLSCIIKLIKTSKAILIVRLAKLHFQLGQSLIIHYTTSLRILKHSVETGNMLILELTLVLSLYSMIWSDIANLEDSSMD